jgi:hypothetical protein
VDERPLIQYAVGEPDPPIGSGAGEEIDIRVVTALQDQVVDILNRRGHTYRLVLTIDGGDRDQCFDREAEVEGDLGVVRIVQKAVEGGRVRWPRQREWPSGDAARSTLS